MQQNLDYYLPNAVWNEICWDKMYPSFQVDCALFLFGLKPAVRFNVRDNNYFQDLLVIFNRLGFDVASDESLYGTIAKEHGLAAHILEVDNHLLPHEEALGALLGYPSCCCRHIALKGEKEIDNVALEFSAKKLGSQYKMLDISRYQEGISLISHVPCSPVCKPSLERAQAFRAALKESFLSGACLAWCQRVRKAFNF